MKTLGYREFRFAQPEHQSCPLVSANSAASLLQYRLRRTPWTLKVRERDDGKSGIY
jgi:hypothetical protein